MSQPAPGAPERPHPNRLRRFSRPVRTAAVTTASAVALVTASAALASPAAAGKKDDVQPPPGFVNPCQGKDTYYRFEYTDGEVDEGCSPKKEVTKAINPALLATELHVSCSDKIDADGRTKKSDLGDPDRRVASYFISKDGGKKNCGTPTPPAPKRDVEIVKSASKSHLAFEEELTYTLRVRNNGTQQATRVVATDPLPDEVFFISASMGCSYDVSSRIVSCDAGNLPAGASAAPGGTCDKKETYYRFEYTDGKVDEGCSKKKEVDSSINPALVATELHISCSDKIDADGRTKKSDLGDPNRRVASYFISKDGGKKTCGELTPTPSAPVEFTIKVGALKSHCNEATVTTANGDDDPSNNSSTVCVVVEEPPPGSGS